MDRASIHGVLKLSQSPLSSFGVGFLRDSFPLLYPLNQGHTMQFDSCHEYHFSDPSVYYCEDHDCMIIADYSGGNNNRLMINGIEYKTILEFGKKYYKESLKKQLNKEDKETVTN